MGSIGVYTLSLKSLVLMCSCKAYIERVPESEQGFYTLPNARIWLFLEMAILCFTSCCSLTHQSCCGLHGVVAAVWLSVFRFCVSLLVLSSSLSSHAYFLLWHHDIDTASAATALGTINFVSVHNFCKQDINCIPKWDECLHTSHT